MADVVRAAHSLEFLDLSDYGLTEEESLELIQALLDTIHPNLDTILLPTLKLLVITLNEDLEGNDVAAEMIERFEGRGGQLVTEDPGEEADLERNALDVEKETLFIKVPLPDTTATTAKAGSDVDELADLTSTSPKIEASRDITLTSGRV